MAGNSLGSGLRASSEQTAAPGSLANYSALRSSISAALPPKSRNGKNLGRREPGVRRTLAKARFVHPRRLPAVASRLRTLWP